MFPRFRKPFTGIPGRRFLFFDWISFSVYLLAIGFSFFAVYSGAELNGRGRIVIEGRDGSWVYPLEAETEVRVAGPLGDTVIKIEGGGAFIASSPCKNQTCVASPHIRRNGSWTACLPNAVVAAVEGGAEGKPRKKGALTVDLGVW
ncbi:MAG: NusG domain II-containing protein [Spirochaetaceae bacterium]|jgi:hypothetical protein|nr:NusG domain II-containing protein [Spirochaetaceae bacterium]